MIDVVADMILKRGHGDVAGATHSKAGVHGSPLDQRLDSITDRFGTADRCSLGNKGQSNQKDGVVKKLHRNRSGQKRARGRWVLRVC